MKVFKRVITALTTAALVVTAIIYMPQDWFVYAFGLLFLLCCVEFWMLTEKKFSVLTAQGFFTNLVGTLVLAFAFAHLSIITFAGGNWALLYVLAVIKLSDMGGFAFGLSSAKLMEKRGGNHKLCPTISPNKSWEGLAGSIIASSLMALCLMPISQFAPGKSIMIGVIAACTGTAGDLVESKFKRWVGVKDSGTFMPAGLGGFLDMFDSLLFAPAILYPFI